MHCPAFAMPALFQSAPPAESEPESEQTESESEQTEAEAEQTESEQTRKRWATWTYQPPRQFGEAEAEAEAEAEPKRHKLQKLRPEALRPEELCPEELRPEELCPEPDKPGKIRLTIHPLRESLARLRAACQIPPYACWHGESGNAAGPAPAYHWNRAAIWFDFSAAAAATAGQPSRDVWVDLRDAYELGHDLDALDALVLRAARAAHAHHTLRAWRNWRPSRDAISNAKAKAFAEPTLEPPDPTVLLFQTVRGLEVTYFASGAEGASGHALGTALIPDQPSADATFAQIIARAPKMSAKALPMPPVLTP
jgi:hypothetical protein